MFTQVHQQRLVGQTAKTVAMQEMQQWLAAGRGSPTTQGEAFGAFMGPGDQLHGFTALAMLGKHRFYKQQRVQ